MGLIKKIQKRKQEKIKEAIIKHGLILFGFNLALTLALFFALTAVMIIAFLFDFSTITLAFIPLLVIFLFAAACAIVWYRFGQILSFQFKKNKILYSGIVVIISVLPLLFILLFLSLLLSAWGTISDITAVAFLGTVFITVLAIIFEVVIVSLGVMTKIVKR